MISRLQLLRNIGQFDSVDAGAVIALLRYVLIYAENGRGKTTLTAILRSLATGDPVPINERRRLAAANSPHVVLQCSVGHTPLVFENGGWNHTFPNMVVFDDRFVNENVYSGLNVDPAHRQNLHELVLGAQGVRLNRRLQGLVRLIEEHNTELRVKAAALPVGLRGAFAVDDFCELPAIDNIADEIRQAEQELAAAQEQETVQNAPGFDGLNLPEFDVAAIGAILARNLAVVDAAAAAHVQKHIQLIGRNGEAWVQSGMERVIHTEDGIDDCPFCAQALAHSPVFGQYRVYFGEEYARLREAIADGLHALVERHPVETPANLERALRVATERCAFWSRFCDVPEVTLDTAPLVRDWATSRMGLIAAMEAKQAAPLERIELPDNVRAAVERFTASRTAVQTLNEQLQATNALILTVKQRAAAGDSQALRDRVARLRAIRSLHSPEGSRLCDDYLAERGRKAATERLREQAKDQVEQ